jgi:hypothetical protein
VKIQRIAVMFAALVLGPAVAGAQAPTPAPVVPTPGVPGNPTNPADPINNPHPTMPWVGIPTPYGQFMRWVWMPPVPVVANDQVVYQPGFWAAQTTAGYYFPPRWVLREVAPGTHGWVLLGGGAVPPAR